MVPTQQSHQMPVKYQQQPAAGATREPKHLASRTRQFEIGGSAAD
jgi:hypothetical protein